MTRLPLVALCPSPLMALLPGSVRRAAYADLPIVAAPPSLAATPAPAVTPDPAAGATPSPAELARERWLDEYEPEWGRDYDEREIERWER